MSQSNRVPEGIAPGTGVLHATRLLWWGVFLLLWTVQVALVAALTYYRRSGAGDPITVADAIVSSAVDWYLWAAICLICIWLAARLPLERHSWRTLVPAFLGWGVGLTLGRGVLDYGVMALLGWEQVTLLEWLLVTFPGRFILFVLFLGLGYAVDYARRHRERELRSAHLRAELATAQLQMLKVQLHPHFLFNTLHAISTLMYVDVAAADRMLVRLSELLRRTLQSMDAQRVTLAEELSFLDPYLEIEKTRLGDRLRVEMSIDPRTEPALVPHLILQPLVENAIRHGISPQVGGGILRIESRVEGDQLVLRVQDDGAGLGAPGHPAQDGVGLGNSRRRLHHLYAGSATLTVTDRASGGVDVTIRLPLETSDAESSRHRPESFRRSERPFRSDEAVRS